MQNTTKVDVFIEGDKINLICLDESFVENSNWYRWFNDEETTEHLQQHYYPNTVQLQKKHYESFLGDKSKLLLGVVDKSIPDALIGVVSMKEIDYINRNAEISLVIGEKEARGMVFAHEAMKLIIDHSFDTLNLYKVYLGYIETLGYWGQYLIKRFGFKDEGTKKEHIYKKGKYYDLISLGLLKKDYKYLNDSKAEDGTEST